MLNVVNNMRGLFVVYEVQPGIKFTNE